MHIMMRGGRRTLFAGAQAPQVEGGSSDADWTARSTAAGVIKALRFTASSTVTNNAHANGTEGNVTWDTTDGIIGDGCLKIYVDSSSATDPGSWRVSLNDAWVTDNQGFGATPFFVQYRVKLGPNRLTATAGPGNGFKMMNLAEYKPTSPNSSQSNTSNEVVLQNSNYRGIMEAYRQDGSGFPDFSVSDGNGLHLQPAVDNGSGAPNDRYCLWTDPGASAGCWELPVGEWFTVYIRLELPSLGGTAGNKFDMYAARDGETSYTHLFNNTEFLIGTGGIYTPNGLNGIWFLPYDTNRTSASYHTWHKYDQLIVSSQAIACPQTPARRPTWMASMPLLTWTEIASSALTTSGAQDGFDSPGGTKGGVTAYSGACIKRSGSELFLAGGGHGDYAGNEVYTFKFGDNAPAWVRRRDPTATVTAEVAYYGDGKPTSRHTSWDLQFDDAANKMRFVGGWSIWSSGLTSIRKLDAFDPTTNDYEAAGTYPDGPVGFQNSNVPTSCCIDSAGNLWHQNDVTGELFKWTKSSNTWASKGTFTNMTMNCPMVYDPRNDRIVRLSNISGTANAKYYSNLSSTVTETAITWGGAQSAQGASAHSVVWCTERESIIFKRDDTNAIYEVNPTTFAITALSVSGTPPTPHVSGTYGRFNYCPDLKLFIYMSYSNTNIWVFRVG